ncbi:MAG: ABC transporter permease [Micrococcaceae bacterium]
MKFFTNILWWLWLPVLLVTVWWFASANSTNLFIPPLSKILEVTARDLGNGVLIEAMSVSLFNLALGLLIAIVVGVTLGLILGETKRLRLILEPYIHFVRSVPQSALVPLIIGIFGLGSTSKIYAVAFACVWPILLNTIDGSLGVEVGARRVSRVFAIPRMLYYRRVVLPGAMPQIIAGIRVALPIGIVVMVVAELFASNVGLGFYILNSSSTFQIPETWGGALLVGVIGYILVVGFSLIDKRILAWYYKSAAR